MVLESKATPRTDCGGGAMGGEDLANDNVFSAFAICHRMSVPVGSLYSDDL
jgi:hypothetical protein